MSPRPRLIIDRHFASISDPRSGNATQHELIDILVIAVCAVISGADNWVEIELWGQAQQTWLKTFLALPNGIPSHDTIGRVFARLDPAQFRECFLSWVSAISTLSQGQVVAIDGKKLRCVGLAQDNRTGVAQAFHQRPVLGRPMISLMGQAKARRRIFDKKLLLNRDGNTV